MSESKFKNLQEDVCLKSPEQIEEEASLDKICPTCVPNPSYFPPDWTQMEDPYLNEKTCEYEIRAMINFDADIYYDNEQRLVTSTAADPGLAGEESERRTFKRLTESPYEFNTLLKSYIRPAVRQMLRHYGKLESDLIVCASPPTGPGQTCEKIFGLDYDKHITLLDIITDGPIPEIYQRPEIDVDSIVQEFKQIKNTQALELYARPTDYSFITSSKILVVKISIPAHTFDAVPTAPDLGELNTETEKVIIKPPDFMAHIDLFKGALDAFKTFQAYFYREENGSLFFAETNEPFYIRFYAETRVQTFVDKLQKLMEDNDFDLKGLFDTGMKTNDIAEEIEISFNKSDPANPFVVENVRAKKRGCPYIECKVGLANFIDYSKNDPTLMGYMSDINNIGSELKNNKTPPWLDFIVSKTFPQLTVNYGNSGNFEDNACLVGNLQEAFDFLLNETVDLFKAIEYRFNQNACKTPEQLEKERNEIIDFFSDSPESKKKLEDLNKAWEVRQQQIDEIEEELGKVGKGAVEFYNDPIKGIQNLGKAIQDGATSAGDAIVKFVKNFNPCDFSHSMTKAMKCLAAGLSLDEVYYTFLKQIISEGGDQAIRIIMETLPANKQEQIRKAIEQNFKDMPFPWEEGWESGSLDSVVDKQARKIVEEEQAAKANAVQEKIQQLKNDAEFYQNEEEFLKETSALLDTAAYKQKLKKEIEEKLKSLKEEAETNKSQMESDLAFVQEQTLRIKLYQDRIADDLNEIDRIKSQHSNAEIPPEALVEIRTIQQLIDSTRENISSLSQQLENRESQRLERSRAWMSATSRIQALEQDLENFDQIYEEEKNSIGRELEGTELRKDYLKDEYKDMNEYKTYDSLSDEDKQEYIDKQKQKMTVVRTTPKDRIVKGTMGKALGNVQKALTQAYIDELMKTASLRELQTAIENIPGANLLGKLISRFKCGTDPLIYPPIDSFLNTLSFDPCGAEQTRISLPEIMEFPTNFNWMEQLTDAFWVAAREVGSRVMIALIMKATELLNTELCRLAGNLTRAALDGGLEGVINELICPDLDTNRPITAQDRARRLSEQQRRDRLESTHSALVTAGGAGGKSPAQNQALVRLLSTSATQREIKEAMVGRADPLFLRNISSLVKAALPEFAPAFSSAERTEQFFLQMGNILTVEQRSRVIDDLDEPFADFPVEASICLTKEEKDLWDLERAAAFSDPNIGKDFVDRQNAKTLSNLTDAIILSNGPEQALQDAYDNAFSPKDPDCKNSIVPTFNDFPQSVKDTTTKAITGIFKNLERAFLNDTVEDSFLSFSFISGDSSGVLIEILSNNKGFNLAKHVATQNNIFFAFLFGNLFGDAFQFPETVAIQLKNQIMKTFSDYEIGKDYELLFDNEKFKNEKYPEFSPNFTSKIAISEGNVNGKIRFRDYWSDVAFTSSDLLRVPEQYEPDTSEVNRNNPFGAVTLGKMVQSIWEEFEVEIDSEDSKSFYEGMNSDLFKNLPKRFVERQEGQSSEGFLFGNDNQPIVEDEDLRYVDPVPGATEYTHNEEEKVLGKSFTDNPRVHFLNPERYGGTYKRPKIYIAEGNHKGWMNFMKFIVPDATGCDPRNSNFLMLDSLVEQITKNKGKIPNHENLEFSPTCAEEIPFDKVSNSDTLATIEGIVRATVRINIADFLIRTFPIFSNIHLDMEENYNNIFLDYMVEKMYPAITDQYSLFASTYEGHAYGLLFLEQVTQIISRRVKDGDMESNEEINEILEKVNEIQEDHPVMYKKDLRAVRTLSEIRRMEKMPNKTDKNLQYLESLRDIWNNYGDDYKERITKTLNFVEGGTIILASGPPDLLNFFGDIGDAIFSFGFITLEKARFATKIYSIYRIELEIKKLLKYIIKEEFDFYAKKVREELEPRPWIYNLKKFFIGGSKMMYGKQTESGVFDAEIPIGGGVGALPYGDVNHCAKRGMFHPLDGTVVTDERYEDLQKNGGFYLEKYVISSPKEPSLLVNMDDNGTLPGGRGLMNISEFKAFLSTNEINFPAGSNVSDFFGNAVLSEDETSFQGSIGIKFGVRLCYMPPEGFDLGLSIDQKARDKRSYVLNPATFTTDSGEKTLQSSKYSFPIASYEQDITDVKMEDLLNSDENLNQDIKCYIDKLVETENFNHLVHNVLQIKKIPSIYMIYSYINLFPALWSESEVEVGEYFNGNGRIQNVFNNCREECRRLFASYYKNDDRHPPNEEYNFEDLIQLLQRKLLNMLKSINISGFSWDIGSRIVKENPFDKDGNECKNEFGNLFSIGGF